MMNLTSQDKKFLKKLGLRLRELREEKGWTLEETEDHGWPSWRHLQRLETGNKNFTVITIKKICHLYGIQPKEFFEGL